jgi:hypothetical protein
VSDQGREFNLRNIMDSNYARFQRVMRDNVYYYVWVKDDNQSIIHRGGAMQMFEFPIPSKEIPETGYGASIPASEVGPWIALAIELGTFKVPA